MQCQMQDDGQRKVATALGKVGLGVRLGFLSGWKQAKGQGWEQAQRNFVHNSEKGRGLESMKQCPSVLK